MNPYKIEQGFKKCQSGEISPYLVTLTMMDDLNLVANALPSWENFHIST